MLDALAAAALALAGGAAPTPDRQAPRLRLDELAGWAERLEEATDEAELLSVLAQATTAASSNGGPGRPTWDGDQADGRQVRPPPPGGPDGQREALVLGATPPPWGARPGRRWIAACDPRRRQRTDYGERVERPPALPRPAGAGLRNLLGRPGRASTGAPRRQVPLPLDRRVPRHRPHPGRAGRAHRLWGGGRGLAVAPRRSRPALLRRRPQAVDLPVPAGRPRRSSWSCATGPWCPSPPGSPPTSARCRGILAWVNAVFGELDRGGSTRPPVRPRSGRQRRPAPRWWSSGAGAEPRRSGRSRPWPPRRPTIAAGRAAGPRRGVAGGRRRPAGRVQRHHRARPYPRPGGCAGRGVRGRRHRLPPAVDLARLRHRRGARPAQRAAGRRRPHRRGRRGRLAAVTAFRLRRRRPAPATARPAAAGTTALTRSAPPTAGGTTADSPGRPPASSAWASSTRQRRWRRGERAGGPGGRGPAPPSSWPWTSLVPVRSGAGCASSATRPAGSPSLRRRPPGLPGMESTCRQRRGRTRRRDGPARDRRRRRAHHDRARVEGPRVPHRGPGRPRGRGDRPRRRVRGAVRSEPQATGWSLRKGLATGPRASTRWSAGR